MTKKRIAVISKRKQIADFFALEAIVCGCNVKVLPAYPTDISEYDVIISDGAQTDGIQRTECLVETISQNGENGSKEVWKLPVSVKRLRALYEGEGAEKLSKKDTENGKKELFLLDGKEKAVLYRNEIISVTDSEWKLICRLSEGRGDPVGRAELSTLFGAADGNIADVYICRLRKKLEEPFGIKLISTVRGKGYLLLADVKKC